MMKETAFMHKIRNNIFFLLLDFQRGMPRHIIVYWVARLTISPSARFLHASVDIVILKDTEEKLTRKY